MVKVPLAILCAAAFGLAAPVAFGDTVLVNGFGVGGWSSWETRTSGGSLLVGTNDSNTNAAAYFNTPATSSFDTMIQKQIIFMDPGKTVTAAGGQTLPADPTGSLNDLGYVRLDGTTGASGKSDLSYVDFQGIAAASVLDDADFGLSYRFYMQPYTAVQPLQVNITVRGTDGVDYTFISSVRGSVSGWNMASITSSSGLFSVSKKGGGPLPPTPETLDDWFNNSTFGSVLFGDGAKIIRVGFVVGQSQQNVVEYLDWAQTSLLNGGDVIDFTGPSAQATDSGSQTAVPLPASAGLGGVLMAALWGGMVIRKKCVG